MSHRFDRSELLDMLTYMRPYDGPTVRAFIDKYIATLPNAREDAFGNWHVSVGESAVLWSCHTDTVHSHDGRQTLRQYADGTVGLSRRSRKHGRSSCLGADDTAGVFLARSMVLAGVPGLYVFHRGEEIGGIGSSALAECTPDVLTTIQYAIALDRQGTTDVITVQGCRRTASDAFAVSLAAQLNAHGLAYAPSMHGIYTDTEEYAHIVSECTNLSIGYYFAHSSREVLDIGHVERLQTALLAFDESALVSTRVPQPRSTWSYGHQSSFVLTSGRTSAVDAKLCHYCDDWFVPADSDADDEPDTFCSFDCETQYYLEHDWRTDQETYLDPDFAAAQRTLLGLDDDTEEQ